MGVFQFTIGNPAPPTNEAPELVSAIPTITVAYITQSTSIASYFTDPDGDLLTYTKVGTWPTHLNLDSVTGIISATVTSPVNVYSDLQVKATDPNGLSVTSDVFSVAVIKGQNRAPSWNTINTQNLSPGSSFFLNGFIVELDGDSLSYSAGVPAPPTIFSLNPTTGQISVDSGATAGSHEFRVRVSDGTVQVDSPLIRCNIIVATTGIVQDFALVANSVFPSGGIFWNNAQKDKRGGIIQWNDGDHVDAPAGANGVRYFNYLGPAYTSRHETIPQFYTNGVDGTSASNSNLQKPYTAQNTRDPSETGPYVHEEDNYHFWYSPAEDKFIWCIGSNGTTIPSAYGARYGVFDMSPWNGSTGAQWIYGNNAASAVDWPSGPYWSQWIKPISTDLDINKNSPHGWSEYLDRGVAINYANSRMFVIDKDETPGSQYRYKISNPLITSFPYRITVTSDTRNTYGGDTAAEWCQTTPNGTFPNPTFPGENRWGSGHNQFLNAGVVVGEWLYFIKPATGGPGPYPYSTYVAGERDAFPDIVVDGVTYKGYKTREFWRIRMVPPYNQYEKLAQFPHFEIIPLAGQTSNNGSWGPSLHYDPIRHKIYCLYDKLWEYTIEPSPGIGYWRNKTPTNFKRVLNSVGALFPVPNSGGESHIIYCAGSSIDGTTTAERRSWNRIKISGDVAPVARWTDCELDQVYPGKSNGKEIGLGKHRTFVYSNLHRRKVGTSDELMYGNTNSATAASTGGYVWSFGGDYTGVPNLNLTLGQYNYPAGNYTAHSGRSDQYRVHTLPVNNKHIMELAVNQIPYYPATSGTTIDPLVTTFGPKHPDGVSIVFDKRGYGWLGPGYFRFEIPTTPNSTGSGELIMYKFRLPEKSGGIAKGDAYEIPPQTVIRQSSRTPVSATVTGVNDLALTPATAQSSYVEGRMFTFTAAANNTGPMTINVSGMGPKILHKNHATAMAAGDFVAGQSYTITYQGFKFVVNDSSISWTMSKDQFGGSHFWGAYDPVDDCLVFATGGGRGGSFFVWRYSCLPDAQGVHRWTRTIVRYDVPTWWQTKANAMTRNGATVTSSLTYNGSQVVIGDNLYFVVLAGPSTNYSDSNIAFMMKINLRVATAGGDITLTSGQLDTDLEMIPFPVPWSTDYDDPVSLINANTADHPQLRSMQALGHNVVLGPASNEYIASSHPWACWYNTNKKTWTVGKTYNQMRAEAPELPATAWTDVTVYSGDPDAPYLEQPAIREGVSMQRGRMVCVPETGEMWYFCSGEPSGGVNTRFGIVKYRILD